MNPTLNTSLNEHSAIPAVGRNEMFHFFKNLAMAVGLQQVVAFGAGAFSVENRRASAERVAV